jgi:hypothetical protein
VRSGTRVDRQPPDTGFVVSIGIGVTYPSFGQRARRFASPWVEWEWAMDCRPPAVDFCDRLKVTAGDVASLVRFPLTRDHLSRQ